MPLTHAEKLRIQLIRELINGEYGTTDAARNALIDLMIDEGDHRTNIEMVRQGHPHFAMKRRTWPYRFSGAAMSEGWNVCESFGSDGTQLQLCRIVDLD